MRSASLLLAILLATAPALSGCLGFGDDDGDTVSPTGEDPNTSDDGTRDGNDTGDRSGGENGTDANSTDGNESDEEQPRWTYENRTGTVSGTNAVVASSGSAEETFTIQPDTIELSLELSAEGGELEMCIRPPGGNDSDGESCEETVTTQDGNASYSASQPPEGEWTVELRPADAGQHSIDYELAIGQLVRQQSR